MAENNEGKTYTKIPAEILKQDLLNHQAWVESGGKRGKKASFRLRDLEGTDLHDLNLKKVGFSASMLREASFDDVDLEDALFVRANLQKANFFDCNLQKARFVGADLTEVFLDDINLQDAILSSANLQHASLIRTNFENAELQGTDLRSSYLIGASMRGCNLYQAKLQAADLSQAELAEANLSHAEFRAEGAGRARASLNLHARQMAGAEVSNAGLPDRVWNGFRDGLANVAEASKKADKLFVGLMAGCVFIFMVLVTAKQGGDIELPIFKTKIPESFFYWAFPAGLFLVYSYLQLYLQRLWERLSELPAIFEDGTPLDKKATPWLLVGYVRAHFKRLRNDKRPQLSLLQTLVIQLLAWWLAPATLAAIWVRYLFADPVWWVCTLQVAATLAGLYAALAFLHRARHTLRLGTFYDPEEEHSRLEKIGIFCMRRVGRIVLVSALGLIMISISASVLFWP